MRTMVEFNAADRGPEVPAGTSLWFMSRLIQLAGEALRDGTAPDSPEADGILRGLLGDADRAAVLDRLTAAANVRVARYRELSAVLNGLEPPRATSGSSPGWWPHCALTRTVNLTCVSTTQTQNRKV
ncbi:hypothetical protein ABZ092_31855 [Streptomyces bobili]|uniref:hypothetical protein n=1 Tax=Streptomyces bobili TaxID=67280 RepID=UPI0033B7E49C